MRRTIYGESRGEPFDGQLAVGWVIRNRAQHPTITWWGHGIVGVCFADKQFSCWNADDPNSRILRTLTEDSEAFLKASAAAACVLTVVMGDPTFGATHYFTTKAPKPGMTWPPEWARELIPTIVIGHHSFFREKH